MIKPMAAGAGVLRMHGSDVYGHAEKHLLQ